jgi:hypothetical protein
MYDIFCFLKVAFFAIITVIANKLLVKKVPLLILITQSTVLLIISKNLDVK